MESQEAGPTIKKQWCIRSKSANIDDYYEINYKTVDGCSYLAAWHGSLRNCVEG